MPPIPPIPPPEPPISHRITCGPLCCSDFEPKKNPEKKIAPTMKTTPAMMPTAAAA
jgi:hypothetical protein